ncbi:hypothetical protein HB775_26515 (plasmid) [Rhizobium leguminosarum bv. trifolii]|nr:hypothetical protein HB775_26515 [Rhizobium leguminosarum bv. trifolii]
MVMTMFVVWVTLLMSLPTLVETDALSRIGLPYLVLNAAAIILTYLVVQGVTRGERENKILRAALKQAPDFLYVKDSNSKFRAKERGRNRSCSWTDIRLELEWEELAPRVKIANS